MTPSRVRVGDGQGLWIDTNYSYHAGRWDRIERRFLGYERVTATDASGASSATSFAVAAGYSANRVTQVDRFTATGVLLERSQTTYGDATAGGVYTSLVVSQDHSWCQGVSLCQTTRSTFDNYDKYGNARLRNDVGDVATPGDATSTVVVYDLAPTTYIVGSPASATVRRGTGGTGEMLRRTEYDHSLAGDVLATRQWLDTTATMVGTSATYDTLGNVRTSTDEVGHVTRYVYDPTYHVYPILMCQGMTVCDAPACLDPAALCTKSTWDTVLGLKTTSTNVNDGVTSWDYDVHGRTTLETRPDGSTTATSYHSWGIPGTQYIQTSLSDGTADGLWSRQYVDGLGRTVKAVDEPDRTVVTEYNSLGLVERVSNQFAGAGVPLYTNYQYDALGRQRSVTLPDGAASTTTYRVIQDSTDADYATPRLTRTTCDAMRICRRIGLNGAGDAVVTSEWDGIGTGAAVPEYRTHTQFDLFGNTTKVTDSVGNVSTMAWDSLGRKTSMNDPDLGRWSYTYDAAGKVLTQTDGNNVTLTLTYADRLGRLTRRSQGATVLARYLYDEPGHGAGLGQLTSMTDTSGSTRWAYDSSGRTTVTIRTVYGTPYSIEQSYDIAGRRKTLTYPDGEIVNHVYNAAGCLIRVGTYVTAATCTPTSTSRTLGNGVVYSQEFDPARRWLSGDSAVDGATVLHNESFTYRPDGLVATKGSKDAADRWSYGYDNFSRLTTATNTTVAAYSSAYSYDRIGRMLTGAVPGRPAYPAVGTGHAHAPSAVSGVAYSYDGAGNLTHDDTTTYTYNSTNRLASTVTGTVRNTYLYDGQGTRVGVSGTAYIELDGQLLYQTDGTSKHKYYYYGSDRIARRDTATGVSYYITNAIGTPHLLLDSTGAVVRRAVYSPYGTALVETGTVADDFGLAGDLHDPGALYKRGVRQQDENTGLFTSPDPSGKVDPTAPQTLNRYAYAANNPVNNVDHSGQASMGQFWTWWTSLQATPQVYMNGTTNQPTFGISILGGTYSFAYAAALAEYPATYTYTYAIGRSGVATFEGTHIARFDADGNWVGVGNGLGLTLGVRSSSVGVTARVDSTLAEWPGRGLFDSLNNNTIVAATYNMFGLRRGSATLYESNPATRSATTVSADPENGSPFEAPSEEIDYSLAYADYERWYYYDGTVPGWGIIDESSVAGQVSSAITPSFDSMSAYDLSQWWNSAYWYDWGYWYDDYYWYDGWTW